MNLPPSTIKYALALIAPILAIWAAANATQASAYYSATGASIWTAETIAAIALPLIGAVVSYIASLSISTIPKELLTIATLAAIGEKFPDLKPKLQESATASVNRLFEYPVSPTRLPGEPFR
jgi:hypothetical protein